MNLLERAATGVWNTLGRDYRKLISWQIDNVGDFARGAGDAIDSEFFRSAGRGADKAVRFLHGNDLVEQQVAEAARAAIASTPVDNAEDAAGSLMDLASSRSFNEQDSNDHDEDGALHEEFEDSQGEEVDELRRMAEHARRRAVRIDAEANRGKEPSPFDYENDRRDDEEDDYADVFHSEREESYGPEVDELTRHAEYAQRRAIRKHREQQERRRNAEFPPLVSERDREEGEYHSEHEEHLEPELDEQDAMNDLKRRAEQAEHEAQRRAQLQREAELTAEAAADTLRASHDAAWNTPVGGTQIPATKNTDAQNASGSQQSQDYESDSAEQQPAETASTDAAVSEGQAHGDIAEQLAQRNREIEAQRAAEQAALEDFKQQVAQAAKPSADTESPARPDSPGFGMPLAPPGSAAAPSAQAAEGGLRGLAARAAGGIATQASNASNYSEQSTTPTADSAASAAANAANAAAQSAAQDAASIAAIIEAEARRAGVDVEEVSS